MKALVVYDSVYGNTEKIAAAIGAALGTPEDVSVLRVSQVKPEQLAGLNLLIVGSPTQKFSPLPAVTKLVKNIPNGALKRVRVAVFDTRIPEKEIEKTPILRFFVRIFGYAAEPVAARLQKKGGELIVPPEGFFVEGAEGPLTEGELERAAGWAKQIIAAL
jgi:flavodoxin